MEQTNTKKNEMTKSQPNAKSAHNIKNWLYRHRIILTGWGLLLLTYAIIFAIKGFYPFGDSMIVEGDTVEQYIPFLQELRRKLVSGETLQFSWAGAGGTDFASIAAYYLCSPLNLIFMWFPATLMYRCINLLYVLKGGLAFYAMYYYCTRRVGVKGNRKDTWENILFAYAYALSNSFISYSGFWGYLDCMIMLPFVMVGLERYVAEGKWKLYTVSLAILVLCNYYLGFMTCIFIVLYYLTLQFSSVRAFVKQSVRILALSVLAVLTSAVAWIPVVVGVGNGTNALSENKGFGFFTDWFDVLQQVWFYNDATYQAASNDNYWEANLYIGIFLLILCLTYFFNKKVSVASRIKKAVLCALLVLSLNEQVTNWVVHLFHYTRGFPNRQMIFLLFTCLALGHESFLLLKRDEKCLPRWRVAVIGGVLCVLMVLCVLFTDSLGVVERYIYSFDLVLLYCILLMLKRKKSEIKRFVAVVCGIAVLELGFNACHVFVVDSSYQVSEMVNTARNTTKAVSYVNKDDSYYTVERYQLPSTYNYNYGFLLGYNSADLFSSTLNPSYTDAMDLLGTNAEESIFDGTVVNPLLSALMDSKYILVGSDTADDALPYTQEVDSDSTNTIKVLEQDMAVGPFVVAAGDLSEWESSVEQVDEEILSYAQVNNLLCEQLSGVSDIFKSADVELVSVQGENCTAGMLNDTLIATQYMNNDEGENEYNSEEDSHLQVHIKWKGTGYIYADIDALRYIGKMNADQEYVFDITLTSNDFNELGVAMLAPTYYYLDETQFENAIEVMRANQLNVTDTSANSMTGEVESAGGTAFSTIAYSDNWSVFVDGERVETQAIANAFLGFQVPAGKHEIVLKYENRAVTYAAVVSVVSILLLAVLLLRFRKPKTGTEPTDTKELQ